MKRFGCLSILLAALLLDRGAAPTRSSPPGIARPRPANTVSNRALPPSASLATDQSGARPVDSPSTASPPRTHKSWKDLAKSHNEEKVEQQPVAYSHWSAAGALAVVVGLILVLARLFRRHAPLFQQALPPDALEVLGRRFVDPRQSILLVRVGARILVVGTSPHGMQSLGAIDDPVEVDVLAGMCRRGRQGGVLASSFFNLLRGQGQGRGQGQPLATVSAPTVSSPSRNPSNSGRQLSRPSPASESADVSSEQLPERISQPEYDLMRRLRGAAPSQRALAAEGLHD